MKRTLLILKYVPLLMLSSCAHLTQYYEANIEGKQPFTTMGCYGPSSWATTQISGISISASVTNGTTTTGSTIVNINVYSTSGGKLSFTSDFMKLRSDDSKEAVSVKIGDFKINDPKFGVIHPTNELPIKPYGSFRSTVLLPSKFKELDIQLPDAYFNDTLTPIPSMHFKSTLKAYIGVCEA